MESENLGEKSDRTTENNPSATRAQGAKQFGSVLFGEKNNEILWDRVAGVFMVTQFLGLETKRNADPKRSPHHFSFHGCPQHYDPHHSGLVHTMLLSMAFNFP